MAITYATHELVAVAWAKDVLNMNAVATTKPQDSATWWTTGFVQLAVTGSASHGEYALRSTVITAHCWAAREDVNAQNAPWGQANQLAEGLVAASYSLSDSKSNSLSLGVTGAPTVRVMGAQLVEDPMRVPDSTTYQAHYTVSVQIWWIQRP